ncbi:MAG TPA: thiol reductant ABC exporter subunit CydD [Patescibacteria group bacterium]|nr:thiol reductant ABC exporter subunit CydD [Patescibacteria group bacterium]
MESALAKDGILRMAARQQWRHLIAVATMGIGSGMLAVAGAYGLTQLLAGVFLGGFDRTAALPWMLGLLAIAAARAGLSWWEETAALDLALRIMASLRQKLLAHLLTLGPVALAAEPPGRLLQVAGEGVDSLEGFYAGYLPQLLRAATVPPLILAVVLPLDGLSAGLMLVTAPLIPLFMVLIGRLAEGRSRQQWQLLARLGSHFYDVLSGLVTLKLFGRSREQAAVIQRLDGQFREVTLGVLRVAFLSALTLELLATLSTAVVAVTVGLRLVSGTLVFEQAFFVLLLAPEYYLALRLLGSQFHAGLAGRAAATDLARLLSLTQLGGPVDSAMSITAEPIISVGVDENETRKADNGSLVNRPATVLFREVHYQYPGQTNGLRGVNLQLAAGERVALVGASGAGKSTLIHLLCGLMAPDAGEIRVDGRLLTAATGKIWRQRLAVVPQRPHVFRRSVAANIALDRPGVTRDMVEAAARQAMADDFIRALPAGYDTLLSGDGEELSGGQRQRLALARAFLQQPALVVLDEAFRGLDTVTEAQVQAALDRLAVGRTLLVVAHRLSTVRQADRILVLADGRVLQNGSHRELMDQEGLYRRLVQADGKEAGL